MGKELGLGGARSQTVDTVKPSWVDRVGMEPGKAGLEDERM